MGSLSRVLAVQESFLFGTLSQNREVTKTTFSHTGYVTSSLCARTACGEFLGGGNLLRHG